MPNVNEDVEGQVENDSEATVQAATTMSVENIIEIATRAVLAAQMSTREQPSSHLNHSDICSQIPQFSGENNDDVYGWIARVDEIKLAYEVNDKVIKVLATKQLTGKAKDWYDCTLGVVQMTWAQLKDDLMRLFGSYESRVSLTRKMEARRWKAGETFGNYFHEKLKLTTKLCLSEVDIIQYVIEGIDNYVLRTQALAARHTRLSNLLESMNLITENKPNQPRMTKFRDLRHLQELILLPV